MQHHGAGLRRLLEVKGHAIEFQDALVAALENDPTKAALEPSDRAMLDYAAKLTRAPETMKSSDVDLLRQAGFDDRAIHDICAIAAYFGFVNRIADGLGVEMEAPSGE